MKYISILIIAIIFSCNGVEKNEVKKNQFDENGFKDGYWIEYLKEDDFVMHCNDVRNMTEVPEEEALNDLEYKKYNIREINYNHGFAVGIVKEHILKYQKNNKQTRTSQPKRYMYRTFYLVSGPHTKNNIERPNDKFRGVMKIYYNYNLEKDINEFGDWKYFDDNGIISPNMKILSGLKDLVSDTSIDISKIDDAKKYEIISKKYNNNSSELQNDLKVVYKRIKYMYDYNPDKIECSFESNYEAEIISGMLDQEMLNVLKSQDKPKESNATRTCEWCGKPNNRSGLYYEYKYCSEKCRIEHKNSRVNYY